MLAEGLTFGRLDGRERVVSGAITRFSGADRDLVGEEELRLTSVGVDIGSATAQVVFSRIVLQRQGTRYVVRQRLLLHESDILFTPYLAGNRIDAETLGRFVETQYQAAGLKRDEVDTGALILTGTALARENARNIAELFAAEAGRLVAVSAGDHLESLLAAHGSGAVALARNGETVLNVDIGGGTTKLALCQDGRVVGTAAFDVGARLVALDTAGRVVRLERAAERHAAAAGVRLALGETPAPGALERLATHMAEQVLAFVQRDGLGEEHAAVLRTPPLVGPAATALTFSGGVAELVYRRATQREGFGDLGHLLAAALRERLGMDDGHGAPGASVRWADTNARAPKLMQPASTANGAGGGARPDPLRVLEPAAGIRATVVGASQYTVQVSGATIFVDPPEALPLRSLPVVAANLRLGEDEVDRAAVAAEVERAVRSLDQHGAEGPVALAVRWQGLATWRRLDNCLRGILDGLHGRLERGDPLVLLVEGDVAGLLGIHLKAEIGVHNAVVSVDGVDVAALDHVDLGALIPSSGAVPVVVKSLVFPEVRSVKSEG